MWTDAAYRSGAGDVITIEPFSTAYFALLQALPELEPYWKAFNQVVVNGRSTSIKLQPGGAKQLDAARMAAIVRGFRN